MKPRRIAALLLLLPAAGLAQRPAANASAPMRVLFIGNSYAIARGGWDAIVLQEQSTRPITDPDKMWRDVKALADAAKKVNAKLVLYETWAREGLRRARYQPARTRPCFVTTEAIRVPSERTWPRRCCIRRGRSQLSVHLELTACGPVSAERLSAAERSGRMVSGRNGLHQVKAR